MNHSAKFEMNGTILTCLNERKKQTVTDGHREGRTEGQADPNYRKALHLIRLDLNTNLFVGIIYWEHITHSNRWRVHRFTRGM